MKARHNTAFISFLIISLFFLCSAKFYSMNKNGNPGDDDYAIVVDKAPSPVGGFESIVKKIIYPSMAIKTLTEGKVYLLIFVNESGDVDDVRIVKGIGGGCDEESARVIKKTKFLPGMLNGAAVKTKFSLALTFKIPG